MRSGDRQTKRQAGQRGSVMIMTAILMAGIILAVGLCIDVARLYMVRTELQNAADAAALAAARELNSGSGGIQDAVTRATTIVNNYGFNDAAVTIQDVDVRFAINLNQATYVSAATAALNPSNYRFVRVTTQGVTTPMLFSARALGASLTQSRSAVAGMSVGINTICDFFPFAVALNDSDTTDTGFTLPAPNTVMTLNFIQGTTEVTAASRPVLDLIRQEVANRPGAAIEVVGHTDTVGSEADNDRLSEQRAAQVVKVLVGEGFSEDLLFATGRGERELKVQTGDNVANEANRRVEVVVR